MRHCSKSCVKKKLYHEVHDQDTQEETQPFDRKIIQFINQNGNDACVGKHRDVDDQRQDLHPTADRVFIVRGGALDVLYKLHLIGLQFHQVPDQGKRKP